MNSKNSLAGSRDGGDVSLPTPLRGSHDQGLVPTRRDPDFWQIDRNLPAWARRSNPIVRRHLGGFLAAPLPQVDVLLRLVAWQAVVILASFPLPGLLELVALVGLVSLIALPVTLSLYGGALFVIGRVTAEAILKERESGALDTLRTTPLTLQSILLSKIAAGLWTQAINLDTIILSAAVFSLPAITIQHATLFDPSKYPVESRVLIIVGLVVSVLRLVLEPFMVGALGVLVGSIARMRIAAAAWTGLLAGAYFILINVARLGNLDWTTRLIVESALPLILPVIISLGALLTARRLLERE